MQTIDIGKGVKVDLARLIESRAVFLANSGAGKSWLIRRVAEQAIGKVQVILIDPEGEFASLREKYDVILCGKGQDVPVEVRSAAMLAAKLLELRASVVVDLYELHPQERQRFVKLFCDALVNCPKGLYHPVLIILDEAHDYVPEGKPSEATYAVEALASKGRKRGQCLVLASQRISKLSKNAAAECNNKLIGRASQDIDMKRAGDELGFSKDRLFSLRQLKPGEFFAFGPAISDEVRKVKVGEVRTTHAKVGYRTAARLPAPSAVIRRVLGALKDLPAESEAEAKTVADLKRENVTLRQRLTAAGKHVCPKVGNDPKALEQAVAEGHRQAAAEMMSLLQVAKQVIQGARNAVNHPDADRLLRQDATAVVERHPKPRFEKGGERGPNPHPPTVAQKERACVIVREVNAIEAGTRTARQTAVPVEGLTRGEEAILNAVAQYAEGMTREHITVQLGYKRSSRDTYLQRLKTRGLIGQVGGRIVATEAGVAVLGDRYEPLPSGQELQAKVMRDLPEGERRILAVVIGQYPEAVRREDIDVSTGYKRSSRDTYIQRLISRQLVTNGGGRVRASDDLF